MSPNKYLTIYLFGEYYVEQHGMALQYVQNQTEEIYLKAVEQNWRAFKCYLSDRKNIFENGSTKRIDIYSN